MKRVPELDGLRGLAILSVLLFHAGLLDVGWMGVNLFFVLSGFLITQGLMAAKEERFSFYFKRFWWRRSLRIFPLYYAFIALAAIAFLTTGIPANTLQELPYLLTYTINFRGIFTEYPTLSFFNYMWSLAVEEQFYLFWPVVMFFLRKKWIPRFAIALILLAPLYRFSLGYWWEGVHGSQLGIAGTIYVLPFSHLDGFMAGAFLATTNWRIPNRTGKWLLRGLSALFVFLGLLSHWKLGDMGLDSHWSALGYPIANWRMLQYVWVYSLIYLLFGAMTWAACNLEEGWYRKVLRWQPLRFLGIVSYGLYIIHRPIQFAMERLFPEPQLYLEKAIWFIPFGAVSIGLGWLSYRYFERKFLDLKSKKYKLSDQ